MKIRILLGLFYLGAVLHGFASMNLDSLRGVLNQTYPDSTNLKNYLKVLAKLEADENPARITLGNWLIYQATRMEDFEMSAKAYNEMGAVYLEAGNKVLASEYLNRGLRVAEEHELYHLQFRILNSFGSLYYEYNQIDLAISYYKRAIYEGKKSSKTTGLGKAYYNLAGMYLETGYQSEDTLRQALNLCNYALKLLEQSKDQAGIINCLSGIGSIYTDLGWYDSASVYFSRQEELIRETGAEEYYVTYYANAGRALFEQAQYNEAINAFQLGLGYAQKFENPRWRATYYANLAAAYENLGNFERANFYNLRCRELNDSLFTTENFETVHHLQIQYETEKKENEIQRLNKDNEIKQLKIKQEQDTLLIMKIIIGSGVVIVSILGLLTFFLLRMNGVRKKANEVLAAKNIEIQKQGKALNQQSKLIARYQSQMNPHFMFNALNNIQGTVINDNKSKTIEQLQLLSKLMRDTLNNSDEDFISLAKEIDYLKRYVQFEQSRFNQKINFELHFPDNADEIYIPPMLIQPFIENAIKHGALHLLPQPEIRLDITLSESAVKVCVSDNGCGFIPEVKFQANQSHAVGIIQDRLSVIWDTVNPTDKPDELLTIVSRPTLHEGTCVTFYLPLNYKY